MDKYGEVVYRGAAPYPGKKGLLDVLVAKHAQVVSNLYFDPKTGRLEALEMFSEEYADPCEIVFSDFQKSDGRELPRTLEARHGDTVFGTFQITEVNLNGKPEN